MALLGFRSTALTAEAESRGCSASAVGVFSGLDFQDHNALRAVRFSQWCRAGEMIVAPRLVTLLLCHR